MGIPRFHWGAAKDAVGSQFLVFIDKDAQSGKSETFTKKINKYAQNYPKSTAFLGRTFSD
jgi:hypothetical protein